MNTSMCGIPESGRRSMAGQLYRADRAVFDAEPPARHPAATSAVDHLMQAASKAFWMLLVMLFAYAVGLETTSAQQSDKPNILFMLNDNTGYGDIGVYGGGGDGGGFSSRFGGGGFGDRFGEGGRFGGFGGGGFGGFRGGRR
jgi:hypothetical protein